MDQRTMIFVVLAAVVVAGGALFLWWYFKEQRSKHLRSRFGPEYDRTVVEMHNRGRAEAELAKREKRVAKLRLRPLTPAEEQRFAMAWKEVQARFVDDPQGATTEADRLLREVMEARGYPTADFEELTADVSVAHPQFIQDYRKAHGIALQHERGQATTEDLRQALVCYRALFEDLLESRKVA
jgi:hypothetical protein